MSILINSDQSYTEPENYTEQYMAALTDLTYEQLAAQVESADDAFFVGEDTAGNITVLISVTALVGQPVENLTDAGIIKLVTRLTNFCRKAQDSANETQIEGEKLNAFPTPISSGTLQDGYVEVTESIKSRIIVSSATQVVGSTV